MSNLLLDVLKSFFLMMVFATRSISLFRSSYANTKGILISVCMSLITASASSPILGICFPCFLYVCLNNDSRQFFTSNRLLPIYTGTKTVVVYKLIFLLYPLPIMQNKNPKTKEIITSLIDKLPQEERKSILKVKKN